MQEQLAILSSVSLDREIKIEHFNVLNYSKQSESDKQLILKDLGMHYLFINLFNKEDFIFIDKIESVLGLDIKNNRMDNISIVSATGNKALLTLQTHTIGDRVPANYPH